mmetsp:Transcript_85161/g.260247  ORF Transcript_85161/g.260247 Transcript_85161/m.260247 type:complete len:207 (-) Transcript_85161:2-622(-)
MRQVDLRTRVDRLRSGRALVHADRILPKPRVVRLRPHRVLLRRDAPDDRREGVAVHVSEDHVLLVELRVGELEGRLTAPEHVRLVYYLVVEAAQGAVPVRGVEQLVQVAVAQGVGAEPGEHPAARQEGHQAQHVGALVRLGVHLLVSGQVVRPLLEGAGADERRLVVLGLLRPLWAEAVLRPLLRDVAVDVRQALAAAPVAHATPP